MGLLFIDNKFFSFTLEDEFREKKLAGETRIPAGTYRLVVQRSDTPLTLKHRKAYGSWFVYHIEISGIRDFSGVYIHAGNDDDHTEGCLLLGDVLTNHLIVPAKPLGSSIQAIKRFYEKVYPLLEKGEQVFLEIKDNAR